VKAWESARRAHVFTPELIEGLQSVDEEFELSQTGERRWSLQRIDSLKIAVGAVPFETTFNVATASENSKLTLQFPVDVSDWKFSVDGERIRIGTPEMNGSTRQFTLTLPHFTAGKHKLSLEGKFSGKPKGSASLEIRSHLGVPTDLNSTS